MFYGADFSETSNLHSAKSQISSSTHSHTAASPEERDARERIQKREKMGGVFLEALRAVAGAGAHEKWNAWCEGDAYIVVNALGERDGSENNQGVFTVIGEKAEVDKRFAAAWCSEAARGVWGIEGRVSRERVAEDCKIASRRGSESSITAEVTGPLQIPNTLNDSHRSIMEHSSWVDGDDVPQGKVEPVEPGEVDRKVERCHVCPSGLEPDTELWESVLLALFDAVQDGHDASWNGDRTVRLYEISSSLKALPADITSLLIPLPPPSVLIPHRGMLSSTSCYIVDNGTDIWFWLGERAEEKLVDTSTELLMVIIQARSRPSWINFHRLREGLEIEPFRALFVDWWERSEVVESISREESAVQEDSLPDAHGVEHILVDFKGGADSVLPRDVAHGAFDLCDMGKASSHDVNLTQRFRSSVSRRSKSLRKGSSLPGGSTVLHFAGRTVRRRRFVNSVRPLRPFKVDVSALYNPAPPLPDSQMIDDVMKVAIERKSDFSSFVFEAANIDGGKALRGGKFVSIPNTQIGLLWDHDAYVFLSVSLVNAGALDSNEELSASTISAATASFLDSAIHPIERRRFECVVYFWEGRHSPRLAKSVFAFKTKHEMETLISRMYGTGDFTVVEVENPLQSDLEMNRGGCVILDTGFPGKVYVWIGRESSDVVRKLTRKSLEVWLQRLNDGRWLSVDDHGAVMGLSGAVNEGSRKTAYEDDDFQMDSDINALEMVSNPGTAFTLAIRNQSAQRSKFNTSALTKTNKSMVEDSVVYVRDGLEPPAFRAFFPGWDHEKSIFDD
ncbi:hypothetical protein HDU93_005063 [Gonapodya sp. JEL0774]|nr:hypothetical protein HDU93_005063 [Gonapodya sp. JEL0774]